MSAVPSSRSLCLVAVVALSVSLVVNGPGQARQPPGTGSNKAANKAARTGVKVKEAALLVDAYVLMAGADHDYKGHRVGAMKEVKEAITRLDQSILKNGTNGEKVVATQQEIATAKAAFIAKQQGKVHEGQALSDAQMHTAGELLTKVKGALPQDKLPKVHKHVSQAIEHVQTALTIR